MRIERLHITIFLALAALVWWIALVVQGTAVTLDHARPFGIVVGFLVVLGLLFEHVLWRKPWIHGWFVKRPDMRGTWRVEIRSDWSAEGEDDPAPRVGFMGVEQKLSSLQMHLMTAESESWFVADKVMPAPSGNGYRVVGVYTNRPDVHLRGDRSEIHHGAIVLDTHGPEARPESLTGEYWTDRKSVGSLVLSGRVNRVYTRYEDATKADEGMTAAVSPGAGGSR